jgi:hypothetical protein
MDNKVWRFFTDITAKYYGFWNILVEQFRPSKTAIRGAAYGIFLVFALMLLIFWFQFLPYISIWVILALVLLLAVLAFIAGFAGVMGLQLIARIDGPLLVAFIAAFTVASFQLSLSVETGIPVIVYLLLFSSLFGGSAWLLIRKDWRKFSTGRKTKVACFGIIGLAGLLVITLWFSMPGRNLDMPEIAALSGEYLPGHIELDDPGSEGAYRVLRLTYGSGEDRHRKEYAEDVYITTEPVDGSFLVDGWEGFTGKMRSRYFGFGPESLPRNALVWYPDGNGPFPLVLIVHGNHLAQDFSDPGYDYLGELLASRGFIFASVDQNFLNGSYTNFLKSLQTENDARGWLLLEHLKLWDEWNSDSASIFFEKADMHNISLIGHSRGGEAVAHAALFNKLPFYPDNANIPFDYNFALKSIVAIAPSDGQYQPSGIRTPLRDISYFVLHGSHDADVQSFIGMRQYARVNFSENYQGFKAGLYIYNANHGQFNTRWGRKDYSFPMINLINTKQLMPGDEQQKIAGTFISAFLEATLNGEMVYRGLFSDYRKGREWLPETIYLNSFDRPGMQYICRFSEDLDVTTATLPGGFIETENLTVWREQMVQLKWGDKDTRAAFIGWSNEKEDSLYACWSVNFPEGSISLDISGSLFFSLADANESADQQSGMDGGVNRLPDITRVPGPSGVDSVAGDKADDDDTDHGTAEVRKPIDFSIELSDSGGEFIRFKLSDHAYLQPQIEVRMTRLKFMKTTPGSEPLYHFFFFPLDRFAGKNKNFQPENIVKITFLFDQTSEGVVIVDDIGFM